VFTSDELQVKRYTVNDSYLVRLIVITFALLDEKLITVNTMEASQNNDNTKRDKNE